MPPKEQTLGLVPIPNIIHFSQSLKKKLFWKGVELIHPHFLTQKNPFEKEKENSNPLFLKLHLQLVILSI
jgi:hypothetical protein